MKSRDKTLLFIGSLIVTFFIGSQSTLAICGDGILEVDLGEMCDMGAYNSDDGICSSTCQRTYCGDGILQSPNSTGLAEACDDGNQINDDLCDNNCCVNEVEAVCGDGIPDYDQGERCDLGANNSEEGVCNLSCQPTYCGDGILQKPNGAGLLESCDDGNDVDGDGCNSLCMIEKSLCGDGILQVERGEECDEGKKNNDKKRCSSECKRTYCGDGIRQRKNGQGLREKCDDGNNISGDGCSSDCKREKRQPRNKYPKEKNLWFK